MIAELEDKQLDPSQVSAFLREMVRKAVVGMLEAQDAPVAPELPEARLATLEAQQAEIRDALRQRNWTPARAIAAPTASEFGLTDEDLEQPSLARQLLTAQLRVLEIEAQVEETFDDPLHLGKGLLETHGLPATREGLRAPMRLSDAIEKASQAATDDVAKKIETIGRLALDFFGDIVMTTLTYDRSEAFLEFVWWLPKGWGKSHGKNRHNSIDRGLTPSDERRRADEHDEALVAAVLADDSLTRPDKRLQLITGLTPRLVDNYLLVQRDMFQRVIVAALGRKRVGRDLDDEDRVLPSHKQLRAAIATWKRKARTPCGLPTRVSKPKHRRSWSLERIAKLVLSPIYQGSTRNQRARRPKGNARFIIRDALYWVPLIMITMGARPEEILQLPLGNVILRNHVFAISIEDALKVEQSRRILPIPQLLLDLGFIQWVRSKVRAGETWMFPEIEEDQSHRRKSQTFGNKLRNILNNLEIRCENEDIYAMRRTLSSKLLHTGVDTGVRQRILGHLEGTTVDAHYSDDGLADLKAILDRVDYGIQIGHDRRFDFPLIKGCTTSLLPTATFHVALQPNGDIGGLRIFDADTEEVLFEARVAGAKLPSTNDLATAPALPKEACAQALLKLQNSHEFLMPGSEEAIQAIEHLLIFAAPPQPIGDDRETAHGSVDLSNLPAPALPVSCDDVVDLAAGRIVMCGLPRASHATATSPQQPGLVVAEKHLAGRRYLDIAIGKRAATGAPRPWQLVLSSRGDLETAQLPAATWFDMRRRILVEAGDVQHLGDPLGCVASNAEFRIREHLQAAGDVSPQPLA